MLTGEAAKLEAAEQSRKRLHARVNGALWQAGWSIMWAAVMPFVARVLVRNGATPAIDIYQYSVGIIWSGLAAF